VPAYHISMVREIESAASLTAVTLKKEKEEKRRGEKRKESVTVLKKNTSSTDHVDFKNKIKPEQQQQKKSQT